MLHAAHLQGHSCALAVGGCIMLQLRPQLADGLFQVLPLPAKGVSIMETFLCLLLVQPMAGSQQGPKLGTCSITTNGKGTHRLECSSAVSLQKQPSCQINC